MDRIEAAASAMQINRTAFMKIAVANFLDGWEKHGWDFIPLDYQKRLLEMDGRRNAETAPVDVTGAAEANSEKRRRQVAAIAAKGTELITLPGRPSESETQAPRKPRPGQSDPPAGDRAKVSEHVRPK